MTLFKNDKVEMSDLSVYSCNYKRRQVSSLKMINYLNKEKDENLMSMFSYIFIYII